MTPAALRHTCGRPWAGFPALFWLLLVLGFFLRLALALLPLEQLLILLEDDAWMVAAIARHLALGRGITADGLHPTNGFHPLYPLTLGVLPYLFAPQALDGGLRVSLVFCALLSTVAAFPLLSLVRRFAEEKAALLAAALYLLNPYFARVTVNAMETALGLFLLLLSADLFFRFDRHRWPAALGAGLLAGLSGLARLDNWLLSAFLGLALLGETLRRRATFSTLTAYGSGVALPALPYFLWNTLAFGSLFPSSGRALAYMHSYADDFSLTNILHFIYLNPAFYLGFLPHSLLALGIGLMLAAAYWLGLARSAWRSLLPVAGYTLVLLGYYAYIQQNSNPRYFVGPAAFFCLLVGALYGRMEVRLHPAGRRAIPLLLLAVALGLDTFEVADTYTRSASMPQLTQPAIYQAACWLREHPDAVPTTALLAAKNSGLLQYYSDHVVLNIDGKLNAEIVPVLEKRELYAYLCGKGVEYLVDREEAIADHLTLYSREFGDWPAHPEVPLLERAHIYLQLLLSRLGMSPPPTLDDPSGFHPTRPFAEAVEVVQTFFRPNTAKDPVRVFRLRCPPPQPAPLAVKDREQRWPNLVTGGAGFIGSHTVDRLLALGHRIRVLDHLATGHRENPAHCLEQIEWIEGDFRSLEIVRQAVEGVDLVLHLGALPSVPRSIRNPLDTHTTNTTGTLHILLAARDAGVRLIVASSSLVYGDNPTMPRREDLPPQPLYPYAAGKLLGEHYARIFYRIYGLETVVLRYFNVLDPRQDPFSPYSGVISFITAALRGEAHTIHGDGQQTRDLTFVENAVAATIAASTAQEAAGEVINVACGRQMSIVQLAAIIDRIVGRRTPIVHLPPREGDVRHSLADISKARHLLGYDPAVDVEEELRRTVAWYREQKA